MYDESESVNFKENKFVKNLWNYSYSTAGSIETGFLNINEHTLPLIFDGAKESTRQAERVGCESDIDIEELLVRKFGRETIEGIKQEKMELKDQAMHMKELYKKNKDLTIFSVLDTEEFYDYE